MLNPTIKQSSNGQKLADTLKRCGIASSVTEANKLAGDIRNTEKKVQTFFDQRKKEIHEDFIQKVHSNRFEAQKPMQAIRQQALSQSQVLNSSQKKQTNDYKTDTAKEMIERAKNPIPLKIQIEFDTPKVNSQDFKTVLEQAPKIEEKKIDALIEIIPQIIETQKQEEKTVIYESKVLDESSPIDEQDYICKFIKNEKEEIPAVEKEEKLETKTVFDNKSVHTPELHKLEIKQELKSENISVITDNSVNILKTSDIHVEEKHVSSQISHPVEQQSSKPLPAVDINNFFNFAKKGKV